MRSKGGLGDEFVGSENWRDQAKRGPRYSALEFEVVDGKRRPRINSISGKERNKMFLNRDGKNFEDVSFLSGADSVADGRCFAIWDYNHDGFQDLAVISMNAPHLQMFHNNRIDEKNNFVAVRLVGGNSESVPASEWSNRDGVGAMVRIVAGDKTIYREQKCGEGFSSQNSRTMIVGIGGSEKATSLSVSWPSGNSQTAGELDAGQLITFFENPSQSPGGSAIEISSYDAAVPRSFNALDDSKVRFDVLDPQSDFHLFIAMATWCDACKRHLPRIAELRTSLQDSAISFSGIPVDESDTLKKLNQYEEQFKPPYAILKNLNPTRRSAFVELIKLETGSDSLPATVVIDSSGIPVLVQSGIPTTSQIRKLISAID